MWPAFDLQRPSILVVIRLAVAVGWVKFPALAITIGAKNLAAISAPSGMPLANRLIANMAVCIGWVSTQVALYVSPPKLPCVIDELVHDHMVKVVGVRQVPVCNFL